MAIWKATMLLAALLLGLAGAARAEQREALVIGNNAYQHANRLQNAVADAHSIADLLKSRGFRVLEGYDQDRRGMNRLFDTFESRLSAGTIAILYYSGHGVQMSGTNVFIPVDLEAHTDRDIIDDGIVMPNLLDRMAAANPSGSGGLNLMIVDACRDNPFRVAGRSLGLSMGLARVSGGGAMVLYAASNNQSALDRLYDGDRDPNGLFTRMFLRAAQIPGLGVREMAARLRGMVAAAARERGEEQVPAFYDEAEGDFVFTPGTPPAPPPPVVTPPPPQVAMLTPPPAPTPATPTVPSGIIRDCPDCPELVRIPAGSFSMGVPAGEEEREGLPDNVKGRSVPVHPVTISQPFLLGRTHVTRRQYAVFARATHRAGGGCYTWDGKDWKQSDTRSWDSPGFAQTDDDPAVCLSFDDAQAYVAWLSARTGQKYRLPSEAEWEYAARAGTSTSRFWGDTSDGQCANANGADQSSKAKVPGAANWMVASCDDGFPYTSPAGHFRPNVFGLYDMLGNAFQWTSDCWNATYAGAPANASSWATGDCASRVVRGGSWNIIPWVLRAGYRDGLGTGNRSSNVGVRVARTLTP